MNNESLLNLKKELELDNMTDEEILRYALKCSQEIKCNLSNRNDRLYYSNLINTLSKADEVILNETLRVKKKDYTSTEYKKYGRMNLKKFKVFINIKMNDKVFKN